MINENDFFSGIDAIKSLRSSGYKNTAAAIGELIDNSIQAEATEVHVVLSTQINQGLRKTRRINEIAVIDNGRGMDPSLLRQALRLGFGTNRDSADGMGKFGMGLPQASISQAKRIDVWSWVSGGRSTSKHAFIDLTDNNWMANHVIEEPDNKQTPSILEKIVPDADHGTIVKWSVLDRIDWKKADTVFNRIENLIGRMYRHWLSSNKVSIVLDVLENDGKIIKTELFKPVDPLFLDENAKSGNEAPETPMFKLYAKDVKKYHLETENGTEDVEVVLTFSIAKDNVRLMEGTNAGSKDFGKLALDCMGVSIVREGRELELNKDWNIPSPKDPRHRWWGAEISFSRDLDDIFGVTNNKQNASRIDEFCRKSYYDICSEFDYDTSGDEEKDMNYFEKSFPDDYILIDVINSTQKRISDMFKSIESKTSKEVHKKTQRHDDTTQTGYDQMAKKRSESPNTRSQTDQQISEIENSGGDRIDGVTEELEKDPSLSDSDREMVEEDVKQGHRCSIIVGPGDTSSFFGVSHKDTQVVVTFYNDHPMYKYTFQQFEELILGNESPEQEDSLRKAYDSLRLIFKAWARMEDEDNDPDSKRRYRRLREIWGEILSDCYDDNIN